MNQERCLEDMIDELHEAVSKLPPPMPVVKPMTLGEALDQLHDGINQLGIAWAMQFTEAMKPLGRWVSYNGGETWIDNRSRWQKIKDKVMRR